MQPGKKIALALTLAVFAASWIAPPWPVEQALHPLAAQRIQAFVILHGGVVNRRQEHAVGVRRRRALEQLLAEDLAAVGGPVFSRPV